MFFSQGVPFNGEGKFKFAIVSVKDGDTTETVLWTNDGSLISDQSTSSVTKMVENGVFDIQIGDTTIHNMAAINQTIFKSEDTLYLRKWFDDGQNGFELLAPDTRILNHSLLALHSKQDIHLYVDSIHGKDTNSGLHSSRAKKTIQAAVDIVPTHLVTNLTIHVAPGTYPEAVVIAGIVAIPGRSFKITGDTSWTYEQYGSATPQVVMEGDLSKARGFYAQACSNLVIEGFTLQNYTIAGIGVENGQYNVNKVVSNYNRRGLICSQASLNVNEGVFDHNTSEGFWGINSSTLSLTKVNCDNNAQFGFSISAQTSAQIKGVGSYQNNGSSGLALFHNSHIWFSPGYYGYPIFDGNISGNGQYGIWIAYDSYTEFHSQATFSGNGIEDLHIVQGGHTY